MKFLFVNAFSKEIMLIEINKIDSLVKLALVYFSDSVNESVEKIAVMGHQHKGAPKLA